MTYECVRPGVDRRCECDPVRWWLGCMPDCRVSSMSNQVLMAAQISGLTDGYLTQAALTQYSNPAILE